MLKFNNEMLIPDINGEIYYAIYELENWVRRICLTAYVLEYGEEWCNKIPKKVFQRLENQTLKNFELTYLGSENDNNLLWSATLGQLMEILENEEISQRLESIIGFSKSRFISKLNELREVRNLLAHNRALSQTSEIIIRGLIESLRLSVKNFKRNTIYNYDFEIAIDDEISDEVALYFNKCMKENDWNEFQAFISLNSDMYSIFCLPSGGHNKYPSASKILDAYKDCFNDIIAFAFNKCGDEFRILVSKEVSLERFKKIVDIFLYSKDIWTDTIFEKQDPRYICNPKIWFYENSKPTEE